LVGVAVNVTLLPKQIEAPLLLAIETEGVTVELTVTEVFEEVAEQLDAFVTVTE
jgi:hypothetical protein